MGEWGNVVRMQMLGPMPLSNVHIKTKEKQR